MTHRTGSCTARMIADAKYIEYDGAPHALFFTRKDQLSNDLLSLLRR